MAQRRQAPSREPINITLPHNFVPRDYQLPFLRAMTKGCKRAVLIWPRRHGKDKTCLNFTIKRMFPQSIGGKIGTYYHIFPTYAQAKKVIWDATDFDGFKVMDHFPAPLIASKNETELQVTLTNGSIYQLIGSDKPESILGTNPVGVNFSEYSVQDPKVSDLLSPILAENQGWAVYNFTPKGHNHAWDLYNMAKANPDWFCERLTVNDTKRPDGTPVITEAAIQALRDEGKTEDFIQQEFYTSFEGFQRGSIYGTEMLKLQQDNHITDVPYDPRYPVYTFWDLGYRNATAIWFMQHIGNRRNFIDYYEQSMVGLPHYAKYLKELPYPFSSHYWPHDGRHGDFSTGEIKRDTGEGLGIRPINIVERGKNIEDGIELTRLLLPKCYFDKFKCAKGISALQAYTYEYDEDRQEFSAKPRHDHNSNGSDALRTCAMSDAEAMGGTYEDEQPEDIKMVSSMNHWF